MSHTERATDLCVATHAVDPDRPRTAVDGLYLCRGHLAELKRLVTEMPARHDDLDRPLSAGGPKTGGCGDAGLHVDEVAADLRRHIAGVVASWCRLVADDRGITSPESAAITHTAPWLARHVEWCAGHRWVDEMLGELRQASGRAIGLTDVPARRLALAEQCLTHADGERCTGTVTLVVRGDDWLARCPVCEVDQDATPYLRLARRGQWVTAADVIKIAGVFGIPCSPDLLYQWRRRKHIIGITGREQNLYDLRSVQTYLLRRRAKDAEKVSA